MGSARVYGDVWAWAAAEPGKAALVALMVGLPTVGALAQAAAEGPDTAGRPGRLGDAEPARGRAAGALPGGPGSASLDSHTQGISA